MKILFFVIALTLAAFPALASPREDAKALYQAMLEHGALLVDILNEPGDPLARRLDVEVEKPISAATQTWLDKLKANRPGHEPYGRCFAAAIELHYHVVQVRRYFQGRERQLPKAAPFTLELKRCETALGIAKPTD